MGAMAWALSLIPRQYQAFSGRLSGNLSSYPEQNIRMLGPRQKCVHAFNVIASPQMASSGGTAQAYYRITTAGENQPQSIGTQNIFPDQGLDILSTDTVFSQVTAILPRSFVQG